MVSLGVLVRAHYSPDRAGLRQPASAVKRFAPPRRRDIHRHCGQGGRFAPSGTRHREARRHLRCGAQRL